MQGRQTIINKSEELDKVDARGWDGEEKWSTWILKVSRQMKMERADGRDSEKSEVMQKWHNNGLRAVEIVPCFPRSQSIQPVKTGIIVFIRKQVLFSAMG